MHIKIINKTLYGAEGPVCNCSMIEEVWMVGVEAMITKSLAQVNSN